MQTWRCLCRWSVTLSIMLRSTPAHTHQSDTASNHSHPLLVSRGLVGELCPKFYIVSWIDVKAVCQPQIWKFVGMNMISWIIALSEWRLFGFLNTACRKDHSQKNLSKLILKYRTVCNQIT